LSARLCNLCQPFEAFNSALYATERRVKYLPSFTLGILLWLALKYAFSLAGSYSPLLDFLSSTANINEYSPTYLLLALHDTLIKLLVCFLFLYGYKKLFSKLPFNVISALVFQLPTALGIILITIQASEYSNFPNFSSYYGIVDVIAFTVSCTSVIFVYWLITAYNKHLKRD
jgi:hypothetical protein